MLNVQIVSLETIKPLSPTPENLRCLQLSLMDQLVSDHYIPLILYYSGNETAGKSSRLKKSLSEVLTRFYPLAGRIKYDDASSCYTHVECNDQGVDFYVTRANCKISELLRRSSIEETKRLLPNAISRDVPLMIQFNVFDCGGSAIGILLSHKMSDGTSLTMLVNRWADATRRAGNEDAAVSPIFNSATLFPPRGVKLQMQEALTTMSEKVVTRWLLFEESKIALLREKVFTCSGLFPTRVEAVSALIWRCSLRARGNAAGLERKRMAVHVVGIRGRMDPPLPEYSFGNLSIGAIATAEPLIDGLDSSYKVGYLEERLRDSIGKIKGDAIRETVENRIEMAMREPSTTLFSENWKENGVDSCMFTSWWRFPLYESDFGWGRPEWLSVVIHSVQNLVVLVPTKNGEAMEVWVSLDEKEMVKFEQDPELLAFASHCK